MHSNSFVALYMEDQHTMFAEKLCQWSPERPGSEKKIRLETPNLHLQFCSKIAELCMKSGKKHSTLLAKLDSAFYVNTLRRCAPSRKKIILLDTLEAL